LREARLNIKVFLRQLFSSRFFYSPSCRRSRIASPTEFVVGVCRSLEARMTAQDLRQSIVEMGQELYAPPNVKGWDGERKWINSASWAARQAFAKRVSELPQDSALGARLDLSAIVPKDLSEPKKIVDLLVDRLLDGELSSEKRKELQDFLVATEEGEKADQFAQDVEFRRQQVGNVLGLILSLPEYHTL
jgi:hypothetical protein